MIDPDLVRALPTIRKPWNDKICEGLAVSEMADLDKYIDRRMRCAFNELHPGLVYTGFTQTDPREALAEMTRPRGSKSLLEMTKSTMVMMRYNFMYNGEKLKSRVLYVPYVEPGGILTLRDTKYVVSPTLSDNLFGITDDGIFMQVTRSRITFRRAPYYFIADGKTVSVDTYWSRLHHTKKEDRALKMFPQLVNYIFAEYGAVEGFKFMGYKAVFGTLDTLNEVDFPPEDWVICRTAGIRPTKKRSVYEETTICVAIERSTYDRTAESVIGSLYYMLDNTSDLDYITPMSVTDPGIWRRVLTRFIWKNPNPVEAANEIDAHIETLGEYLDEPTLEKLFLEDIDARTFSMLLRHMVKNFSPMTIGSNPAGTHDKHLTVVQNIAFGAVKMIFKLMFELSRLSGKKLTKQSIETIMGYKFNQFVFYGLTNDHPEMTVLESATNALPFKTTGLMVRPSKSNGGSTTERDNPAFHLDGEFFTAHSCLMITKSSPSAVNRVNPNLILGKNNKLIADPELEPLRAEFERLK